MHKIIEDLRKENNIDLQSIKYFLEDGEALSSTDYTQEEVEDAHDECVRLIDELKKIENWLSGLPEGKIFAGVYAEVKQDKICLLNTWGKTSMERLNIDEFKRLYPHGKLYGYPWEK